VAYLIRLGLVHAKEGRLILTPLGRERYRDLPNDAAMSAVKDEAAAILRRHLLRARPLAASGMPTRRHSTDLRGLRHDLGIGVRDMAAGFGIELRRLLSILLLPGFGIGR
jgi:hypothetical protein